MNKIFNSEVVAIFADILRKAFPQMQGNADAGAQAGVSKPSVSAVPAFIGNLLSSSVFSGFLSGGRPEGALLRGSLVGLASGVDAVRRQVPGETTPSRCSAHGLRLRGGWSYRRDDLPWHAAERTSGLKEKVGSVPGLSAPDTSRRFFLRSAGRPNFDKRIMKKTLIGFGIAVVIPCFGIAQQTGSSASGAATGAPGGQAKESQDSNQQGKSNQSAVPAQTPATSGPAPDRTGSTDASSNGLRPAAPGIPAGIRPAPSPTVNANLNSQNSSQPAPGASPVPSASPVPTATPTASPTATPGTSPSATPRQ